VLAIPLECDGTKPIRKNPYYASTNSTYLDCKNNCDSNSSCTGYVYNPNSRYCNAYSSSMKNGPYGPGNTYNSSYQWSGASSYIKL
jgi:hypothetical protein